MRRIILLASVGLLLASQTACASSPSAVHHPYAPSYGVMPEAAESGTVAEVLDYDAVAVGSSSSADGVVVSRRTASATSSAPSAPARPSAPAGAPPPAPPPAPTLAKEEAPEPPSSLEASRGPMLVYTAQLSLATFEAEAALASVEKLAKDKGGFLSKRERLAITIRVPAERFSETLHAIEKLGDVLDRNVSARDVTDEFFDMEARLRSARAIHARLLELLQKADKIEESIAIEKELGRVLQEIERLEGRLKLLRDQLAYSTITASFRPKATEIVGKTTPFRLPGAWLDQLGLGRLMRL